MLDLFLYSEMGGIDGMLTDPGSDQEQAIWSELQRRMEGITRSKVLAAPAPYVVLAVNPHHHVPVVGV